MNAIENMLEVKFLNNYILSNIIDYIPSLTIIIALAIKVIGFSKVRQTFGNIFAMYCGDIKY